MFSSFSSAAFSSLRVSWFQITVYVLWSRSIMKNISWKLPRSLPSRFDAWMRERRREVARDGFTSLFSCMRAFSSACSFSTFFSVSIGCARKRWMPMGTMRLSSSREALCSPIHRPTR